MVGYRRGGRHITLISHHHLVLWIKRDRRARSNSHPRQGTSTRYDGEVRITIDRTGEGRGDEWRISQQRQALKLLSFGAGPAKRAARVVTQAPEHLTVAKHTDRPQ